MDKYKEDVVEDINLNNIMKNKENKPLINISINEVKTRSKNNFLLAYISLIKIISAFLVILKHTNRDYWVFSSYWVSTNIMASFCMCAVPLFSLCIGATLLNFNERYDIKEYWKRRFNKIIVPIIGWNIIYYIYRVYILKNYKIGNLNFITLYKLYFNNELYPIIDSLRIFIYGYMVIPLIAYVQKINKIQIYSYCFLILLINQSIIPYLLKFNRNNIVIWP